VAPTARQTVDGWKAIAAYLSAGMPIEVSRAAARHYRERAHYALPVHGCGVAKRVWAYTDELDRWVKQHRAAPALQASSG
jgi:hypothetical protein